MSLSEIEQHFTPSRYNTCLLEAIESLDHRHFIEKKDGKFKLTHLLREYTKLEPYVLEEKPFTGSTNNGRDVAVYNCPSRKYRPLGSRLLSKTA